MQAQSIEVHYMDASFTKLTDSIYLQYNDRGTERWEVKPGEVKRHLVTGWFEPDLEWFEKDAALLEWVYGLFQNGVPGLGAKSGELHVRSMMVGDRVVLRTVIETNGAKSYGPKRVYEVAGLGFTRIS